MCHGDITSNIFTTSSFNTIFHYITLCFEESFVLYYMLDQEKVHDAETLAWLQDYFQLDVDLEKLYNTWEELDPIFGKIQS